MLTKQPKPAFKTFISRSLKAFIVAESIGIVVAYGVWFKLNTDRDFRLYMHRNFNPVLEGYYYLGEYIAQHKTRELDNKVWRQEGKI